MGIPLTGVAPKYGIALDRSEVKQLQPIVVTPLKWIPT